MSRVCVDAGVVLAILLADETLSAISARRRQAWAAQGIDRVAPPPFDAEVTSGLRLAAHSGRVSGPAADAAFDLFKRLRVGRVTPTDRQDRAWELSKRHDLACTHDAQYVEPTSRHRPEA